MPRAKDWVESSHEGLYNQSRLTKNYLNTNLERFGIEGASADWVKNVFYVKYDVLTTAYLDWLNPSTRTPMITSTLKDAENDFIPAYRQLYTGFLKNNPNVKNEDLIAMGLPERSNSKPKPTPDPHTVPEANVELPSVGVVLVHFQDKGSTRKAKPEGVHGAEIVWEILETPPTDWNELKNSTFDTHTPYKFSFGGANRGQKLYFALRWENTRGVKGDWSEIYETIIP